MTSSTERRDDQIGAFFATHAERLQRAVRSSVQRVAGEIIEDACQVAWTKLLRRPDITLDSRGFGWLTTVAVHEAWRQGSLAHERPAGAFTTPPDPGTDDKALDRIEHQERLQAMHVLKPREREALYLKGLGYSYQEIMTITNASYTAVNRRITEGRAALRHQMDRASRPRTGGGLESTLLAVTLGGEVERVRPKGEMTVITYQHQIVAIAGIQRFYLAPAIAELPDGDPLKTFVCFLALYARDVHTGALPGDPSRYLPRRAERYARAALMPAREFLTVCHRSDHQLAEHFHVPLEQIVHRREELAGGPTATNCGRHHPRRSCHH
jgi:DNA-directed RNA polymerase specialized sigma24 family protein